MASDQLFIAVLRTDAVQSRLASLLSPTDLASVRTASSACCNLLTKRLFARLRLSFNASSFTKPSRVAALASIGHHVQRLSFILPHSEATFLPPLIHPQTGREMAFLYAPHTSITSVLSRPKYANPELGDVLTQQYPPLFHAATNVPSFINAMRLLPNLRHLIIRCPGQDPRERYRRDAVDYALISLRIAVERASLTHLSRLSLEDMHPASFIYLRHVPGFGSVPSGSRRWRQITRLHISVEAWDFYDAAAPGLDHLKIMDDYIRCFAGALAKFSFTWLGRRGPCPIALAADPLFAPPRASKKLFHEVTSPNSPLPTPPAREPIVFTRLRLLHIRNATMNAPQLKTLIRDHRSTVKEYDFDNVVLSDRGSWDDALAPLDDDDAWSRSSRRLTAGSQSQCSIVTSESSEDLCSAAVEAVGRELLDVELGGGQGLGDENRGGDGTGDGDEILEGLSEDVAAAREASLGFTTKLKKRRVRRRRKHHEEDVAVASPEPQRPSSPQKSLSREHSRCSGITIPRATTPHAPRATTPQVVAAPETKPVILLQPTVYNPSSAVPAPAVQRNMQQEAAHQLLAEDAAARVSALHKAKAAVLAKLSREFRGSGGGGDGRGNERGSGRGSGASGRGRRSRAAAEACRLMSGGLRDFAGCGGEMVVVEDRRVLAGHSALVPLMFSRS